MEIENKEIRPRGLLYDEKSEIGRMKLMSVKENLYEATTKVVQYSIEMYAKKSLSEWVRTDLLDKLDTMGQIGAGLRGARDDLKEGGISKIDITNGCLVINNFVRKDALALSRNVVNDKINQQRSRLSNLEDELQLLSERRAELEAEAKAKSAKDTEEDDTTEDPEHEAPALETEDVEGLFDEDVYGSQDSLDSPDTEPGKADSNAPEDNPGGETENLEDEDNDGEDDEDDEDVEDVPQLSEEEQFRLDVAACKDIGRIDSWIEKNKEEYGAVSDTISELNKLTDKGGKGLTDQNTDEKNNLESLRQKRNTVYAHRIEDKQDISEIGEWVPSGGELYTWATAILAYVRTIEKRYAVYALFDEYYAAREGKEKFSGCKVYVQRQIQELYVNRSNVVMEFAGDLYDKEDEEFNFQKLIESMAYNWDTGIRYLTVVTNEDMPELNNFFKGCLSGTKKYVDFYLIDRNALRDACKKKNSGEADYIYFRLLYHMNPVMEDICWKGRSFDPVGFAWKLLYKIVKARNAYQLSSRLENYEDQLDGIDIKKWCEHRMLSEIYFAGRDDDQGAKLARNMEDGILEFCSAEGKDKAAKFRKAVRTSAQLYFYMKDDYSFTYKTQDKTLTWNSLEDVSRYIEDIGNFKSYIDIRDFVDDLNRSYFFKVWKNTMKKRMEEGREQ